MLPEEDLTFPFGKDQFECLPFRTTDGFAAVVLDLIEGFAANSNNTTAIFLKGNGLDSYNSTESVPQLVKRFNYFLARRREAEKPPVVSPASPSLLSNLPIEIPEVPLEPATTSAVLQGVSDAIQATQALTRQVEEAARTEETPAHASLLNGQEGEAPLKRFPFQVPRKP